MVWACGWWIADLLNDLYIGERQIEMIVHHLLGLVSSLVPLISGQSATEVCTLLVIAEVSTPFLSLALVFKDSAIELPLWVTFAIT